jgi:CDP-2,3-bis-(O-geranylgeranyl)-sn-glycerol synthase
MGDIAIKTLWLFLPGLVANMMPVFASRFNWLPALNAPLDMNTYWRGKPLLGPNKTVRGLLLGIVSGSVVALVQYHSNFDLPHVLIIKNSVAALSWGALLGCGALFGDVIKSFIKRRKQIPSGQSWWPWDQIDIALGMLCVSAPLVQLTIREVVITIVSVGILMTMASVAGVMTGIKKQI